MFYTKFIAVKPGMYKNEYDKSSTSLCCDDQNCAV